MATVDNALVAMTLLINTLETATKISQMIQKAQSEQRELSASEWKVLKDDYKAARAELQAAIDSLPDEKDVL